MNLPNNPTEECVRRSLHRVGIQNVNVHWTDSGTIRLSGCVPSASDRSLAHAVTRTTVGVTSVANDVTIT